MLIRSTENRYFRVGETISSYLLRLQQHTTTQNIGSEQMSTRTIKMFGIVNSLIKPKTESLPYFVSTEECCNKFADFFI